MTKRLRGEEGGKLDRLTDLPINVIHQIQEYLSFEDAARMSVLSRPWRQVWASIPSLKFSTQFCKDKPSDSLIDIVSTILLQHDGAIKTFHLNISSIASTQHSVIDQWMLLLSRNGLIDLSLENLDSVAPYTLPSCVYGVELESLNLSKCISRLPSSFRGFHKLKRLSLLRVTLKLDVATSFLWMPNLESLHILWCSGISHLKMYAPQLLELSFYAIGTDTLKLGHFLDCRKLKKVALASRENQEKAMNLTNLFSSWPTVYHLLLDSYYLKLCSKKKDDTEVHVNHFEGPAYRTQGLNKLQELRIKNFHGSRNELLFVRFILGSAPLLLKTILVMDGTSVSESHYSKISKELMGFPRASRRLGIICEPMTS